MWKYIGVRVCIKIVRILRMPFAYGWRSKIYWPGMGRLRSIDVLSLEDARMLKSTLAGLLIVAAMAAAEATPNVPVAPLAAVVTRSVVGDGWANNSVNAVVFRKNSLVTHLDTQYIA